MKRETCETCKFFSGTACHVNPPMATESGTGFWPFVDSDGWCGRYQPNKTILEQRQRDLEEANERIGN